MQVQWHGSPGQLGLRVTWFLGHWVAGSQNVTQFHVWYIPFDGAILMKKNLHLCIERQ